jgi:hypothetical protein
VKKLTIDKLFAFLSDEQKDIVLGVMDTMGAAADAYHSRKVAWTEDQKPLSIEEELFIASDEPCAMISEDKVADKVYDENGILDRVMITLITLVQGNVPVK